MNKYQLQTMDTDEIEYRLRQPVIRGNNYDALERLECTIELARRRRWTIPPMRRPWTAVEDDTPCVGEPVLCWRPGTKRGGCQFFDGSVFVAHWSGSAWILTETGAYAERSNPEHEPTHWRPLPSTR